MELAILRMHNFRQFYGEQQINFARGGERNVTLIHGENGVGKTTILNAVLWCFFERFTGDFERPDEIISFEATENGEMYAVVEIWFNHENDEYLAQRTYANDKKTAFRVFRINAGNYEEVPNPDAFINSILPRDMAGYFFFHGEGISALNDAHKGSQFRRAIRDILGFTFAEQAQSDLRRVKSKYVKEAKGLYKRNSEQQKAAEERDRADKQLDSLREEKDALETELNDLSSQEEQLIESLSRQGGGRVKEIKDGIKSAEQRINTLTQRRKEVQRKRQDLIARYGWAVFGRRAAKEDLSFIDTSAFRGRVPAPYQDTFVQDLLEEGTCVCGRPLPEGSQEWKNVSALRDTASTAAISQKFMRARSVASTALQLADTFLEEVGQVEEEHRSIEQEYREAQNERESWEKKLDEVDEEEVERLKKERKQVQQSTDQKKRRLGQVEAKIREEERNRSEAARRMGMDTSTDARIGKLNRAEKLVDQLTERVQNRLSEFEQGARRQIAHLVNEILANFSRKNYEVRVTDDFEFNLVRQDGGVVAKSRGENLLLNLAFVAALIALARERERASGDFLVQGTVAPFVIDAPFGELDETYKSATAQFLPSTSKQLVVLVSSSHWKGTVEQALEPYVGKEFILVSYRRDAQSNKPEDSLTIRGRTHQQSLYEQERDMTEIEEIES